MIAHFTTWCPDCLSAESAELIPAENADKTTLENLLTFFLRFLRELLLRFLRFAFLGPTNPAPAINYAQPFPRALPDILSNE